MGSRKFLGGVEASAKPETVAGSNASEPRPRTPTAEMRRTAAAAVVETLCEPDQRLRENMIRDLAKHAQQYDDGYVIAKTLEGRCGWDCNAQMVEHLDNFSHLIGLEIEKAEREWAKRNNIQPPLPNGTRVSLKTWNGVETGTVDGIYEYGAAKFLVKIDLDDHPGSRRIVNFEDAHPIATEAV